MSFVQLQILSMNSDIDILIGKSNCRTRPAAGFHPSPPSQKDVFVGPVPAGEVVVVGRQVYRMDWLLKAK